MEERIGWQGQNESQIVGEEKRNGILVLKILLENLMYFPTLCPRVEFIAVLALFLHQMKSAG